MFRAIKRVFIWLGLMAEKATETDAINQAVVERGIRDSKAKADKAHYANGQLAGQIALLKDQIKRQERQREELQGLLQAAAAANDEANGAHYAEELATLEQDLNENKSPGRQPRTALQAEHADHRAEPARDSEVPARVRSGQSQGRHRPFAGEPGRHDEKLHHRAAGHDGRRDGPIHAATPPVRRRRRRPDARHAGSRQGNGLRHFTPAGDAQGARRDALPGIQKEDGHGAAGSAPRPVAAASRSTGERQKIARDK